METYAYVLLIVSAAAIGENPRSFGIDCDNPLSALPARIRKNKAFRAFAWRVKRINGLFSSFAYPCSPRNTVAPRFHDIWFCSHHAFSAGLGKCPCPILACKSRGANGFRRTGMEMRNDSPG